MATPGHFLEKTIGIMPLTHHDLGAGDDHPRVRVPHRLHHRRLPLMPKKVRSVSEFPASEERGGVAAAARTERPPGGLTLARAISRHSRLIVRRSIALGAWLYLHFFVKDLSLDINTMNTIVLLLGVILHGNVYRFTKALRGSRRARLADRGAVPPVRRRRGPDPVHAGRRVPGRRLRPDLDAATRFPLLHRASSARWCRSSSRPAAASG